MRIIYQHFGLWLAVAIIKLMHLTDVHYQVIVTVFLVGLWLYCLDNWKKYLRTPPEQRDTRTFGSIGSTAGIVALGPVIGLSVLAEKLMPEHKELIVSITIVALFVSIYLMGRYIYVNKLFKEDAVSVAMRNKRK